MSIDVDDESYHFSELMDRDDVTLYFSLPQFVEFPIGCYIEYMAKTYTLYAVDKMRMVHRRDYEYTITFESIDVQAGKYIFSNPIDGRFKFPMAAKPQEHLAMVCQCLSQKTGVTWTPHCLIESPEKLISYDSMTCRDAIAQIAAECDTEYRFDGTHVYLGKVEFFKDDQITISFGKGNGIRPGVEKVIDNSEKIIGRVYIQGGERNIDYSQYRNATLLLPKNRSVWYDGETFYDSAHSGATKFTTSADGRYVYLDEPNAPISEGALDLSDVYPCYDHEVSSVEEVDSENHFWDIYSDTFTAGQSTETKVNYDPCLIENGQDMTIIFQSGMLAGREFGVKWKKKTVEGVDVAYMEMVPSEQDGYTMPDRASGFYPAEGNVFRVFNVYLPDTYVQSAEIEMLHKAVSYLYEHCREKFSIKGEVDPNWSASRWLDIGSRFKPGSYFRFVDPVWQDDGVSIRVTSVKTFLNKPHKPIVELSNSIGRPGVSSALKRIEAEAKTLPETVRKDSVSFTKRQYRDAKETMEALAQAMLEGFSESISPITVQTMLLIAGSEALQFQFFTDRTCVSQLPSPRPFTYDSQTKQFKAEACALKHMTLGIDDIRPAAARTVNYYLRWTMASYESSVLDEPTKKYYVYAKCDSDNDGTIHLDGKFHLSENAVEMGPHAETENNVTVNYYYFLCGILNSEREGNRSFAPVYGFTEILPGQITTDVIRSSNGLSYFDLVSNAFNLGDKLKFNVNNSGQLVLNGTFVQTGAGNATPISAWCGEYSSLSRYQKGDEVYYQVGTAISTYRYKSDTPHDPTDPTSVHAPTDSAYWEPTSVGGQGGEGQGVFKSIVFKRSDTTPSTPPNGTTPNTSTWGGSYLNPVPYDWSDGVPSGSETLWMSTRVFTSDGQTPQESGWTTPQKATSGDDIEYRWSASSSQPSPPGQGSDTLSWRAVTDVNWIHITSGSSGSTSGNVGYSVDSYSGTGTRTGHITIQYGSSYSQSKTFTIVQSGTGTTVSPLTLSGVSASGVEQTFNVTAGSSVAWTVSTNDSWITLDKQGGTGSGTFKATLGTYAGASERTGSIVVSDGTSTITISVSQNGVSGQNVGVSYPSSISTSADTVRLTISDPDNHGWLYTYTEWYQWGYYLDDISVISGQVSSCSLDGAIGTGNAVLELSFKAGSSTLQSGYVKDSTTNNSVSITINRS